MNRRQKKQYWMSDPCFTACCVTSGWQLCLALSSSARCLSAPDKSNIGRGGWRRGVGGVLDKTSRSRSWPIYILPLSILQRHWQTKDPPKCCCLA